MTDTFVLLCTCGCDTGFVFRVYDDEMFVSLFYGYFSDRQKPHLNFWREKIRLLFGESKCVSEIILNKENLTELLHFLQAHPLSEKETGFDNDVHIEIENLFPEEEDTDCYSFCIQSDMKKSDILFNKMYRMGELVYSDKERLQLIELIQDVVRRKV